MLRINSRLSVSYAKTSGLVLNQTRVRILGNLRTRSTNSNHVQNYTRVMNRSQQISSFSTSSFRLKSAETQFEEMTEEEQELLTEERAIDTVDVAIVGGGPAGLATAIKLKQLDESGDLRVIVFEKAPDMGSHIVSGAILEPRALRELFPESEFYDENGEGIPLPPDMVTLVEEEHMKLLMGDYAIPLPEPPQMRNKGKNYVASLSEVTKYLSEKADELGIEIYSNISVSELVYDSKGHVKGVATKDMGISKSGVPKDEFERGMEFHARMTVLAEGCHGSLSKQVINKFNLREGKSTQTYGLGIKEIWEVDPAKFKKGYIAHTLGYPLDASTYGGGFQYHFGEGLVAVGLVVGLDYKNPWISPYQEFQKMKHHPFYKSVLEGGKCISYGARALNEGGFQSVPQLYFPGGVLVGASAGFMNVPKIKGSHTAMKSGMLAAEALYPEVIKLRESQEAESSKEQEEAEEEEEMEDEDEMVVLPEWEAIQLKSYEEAYKKSWVYEELYEIRNVRPSFHTPLKLWGGMCFSGLITLITRGKEPFTLKHKVSDAEIVEDASKFKKIEYPSPDGVISFDILTSVSRTGTYHKEDEQCHLRVPEQDLAKHAEIAYPKYQGIEQRFCPAGVYEYLPDEDNKELGVKFQINSQNCIHCKTCDIKVPTQDINWTVPEGGDGPKYQMT